MFLCHFLYTLLCSRCGYLALNFIRSNVFCCFLGWRKIFLINSLYLQIKYYICIGLAIKQLVKIKK